VTHQRGHPPRGSWGVEVLGGSPTGGCVVQTSLCRPCLLPMQPLPTRPFAGRTSATSSRFHRQRLGRQLKGSASTGILWMPKIKSWKKPGMENSLARKASDNSAKCKSGIFGTTLMKAPTSSLVRLVSLVLFSPFSHLWKNSPSSSSGGGGGFRKTNAPHESLIASFVRITPRA
jgi:hypothetical protein